MDAVSPEGTYALQADVSPSPQSNRTDTSSPSGSTAVDEKAYATPTAQEVGPDGTAGVSGAWLGFLQPANRMIPTADRITAAVLTIPPLVAHAPGASLQFAVCRLQWSDSAILHSGLWSLTSGLSAPPLGVLGVLGGSLRASGTVPGAQSAAIRDSPLSSLGLGWSLGFGAWSFPTAVYCHACAAGSTPACPSVSRTTLRPGGAYPRTLSPHPQTQVPLP